jgi:hypothetical protein
VYKVERGNKMAEYGIPIATVVEAEKQEVKVGDIFYTSWGYDQTNVEFYKVVRATKSSVWIQQTGQTREYSEWGNGDYWTTKSTGEIGSRQVYNSETGEYEVKYPPITMHRIQYSYGKPAIRINYSVNGWFWDGEPKQASTGH